MFVDNDVLALAAAQVDVFHIQGHLVVRVQVGPDFLRQRGGIGSGDGHLAGLTLEGGQGIQILLIGVDEVTGAPL